MRDEETRALVVEESLTIELAEVRAELEQADAEADAYLTERNAYRAAIRELAEWANTILGRGEPYRDPYWVGRAAGEKAVARDTLAAIKRHNLEES